LKLNALDKNIQYVVCCDTGRRSSAAAYILSERGFEAYVLKGGLAATEAARSGRGLANPPLGQRPARCRRRGVRASVEAAILLILRGKSKGSE